MNFAGKTALITGSGALGGLGYAVATELASKGASVVITGRNASAGAEALRALQASGADARFIEADLSTVAGVRTLATEAGPVDVLINNAAIVPFGATEGYSEELYESAFAANVRAVFFLTSLLVPKMVERGGGSVINVSSTAARLGIEGLAVYGATKAAVEAFTRTWATEFADAHVRVNAVSPGPMLTATTVALMGPDVGGMAGTTALKRAADPQEVANVISYVASDDASFVTGAVVAVDGGRTAI